MGETETLATGVTSRKDVDSVASSQVPSDAIVEVDFYRNPTILSRLILNQKYASAIKRLRLHPEEASVWVCSKRQRPKAPGSQMRHSTLRSMLGGRRNAGQRRGSNSSPIQQQPQEEYSLRQLPIHMACGSLFRTSDAKLRAELEKLITHLVVASPDGCGMVDHEGKLPLHEAIWHNASPETISMLLMASPGTLHERDKFGRSPLELNRFRSGSNKAEIKELLLLGVEFWKQARQEAKLRLKHAFIPPCNTSVGSVSVLAMNQSDMGSIGTGDSSNFVRSPVPIEPTFRKPITIQSDEIEPIAWSQLEKRALHLEQLLAEMYEKNYDLGEVIEELTRSKMEMHDELELLQGADLAEEVLSLRRENTVLTKEVAKSQHLLKEQGFEAKIGTPNSSRSSSRSRSPRGSRGRSSLNMNAVRHEEVIEYLEDRNSSLQQRVDELTESNREQQLKMDRLEMVIGSLWKQGQSMSGDSVVSDSVSREALSWLQHSRTSQAISCSSIDADTSASVSSTVKSSAAEESSFTSFRSSAAVSMASVPRDSDASLTSREDYTNLLERLQSSSRFATERYLAGKVRDLEEKLNTAMDSAEAEVTASREERYRLLKENEVLVAQVRALSSRSLMTGDMTGTSSTDPLRAENLDELFQRAAAMYESDTSSGTSSSISRDEKRTSIKSIEAVLKGKKAQQQKRKTVQDESYLPGGLAGKVYEPMGTDDINILVKEAQEAFGKPLPSYLIAALEGTSSKTSPSGSDQSTGNESSGGSSSGNSGHASVEGLFQEAERLLGGPLPGDLVQAFQRASTKHHGTMKRLEEHSKEDSSGKSGESSDVDSIIGKAEEMMGEAISEEMAMALRYVWPDSEPSISATSDSAGGFFEDSTASRTDRSGNSSSGGAAPLRAAKREYTLNLTAASTTQPPPPPAGNDGGGSEVNKQPPVPYEFSSLSPAATVKAIQDAAALKSATTTTGHEGGTAAAGSADDKPSDAPEKLYEI